MRQTIPRQFILSAYLEEAIARAIYDKLEDNTYSGRIPECKRVIAFGSTLNECAAELRSTLEEWVVLGLKMGHPLPLIAGIDLNKEPEIESMETVSASILFVGFGNWDLKDPTPARSISL